MSKETKLQEITKWVIRLLGLFLIICWAFFYRDPITLTDGNLFYRMGAFAESLVILLVLAKVALFKSWEENQDD